MATRNVQLGPAPYASGADFCRIFEKDMDRLYLLSFLLTADERLAEKCFVQGLQDARDGNRVFKEWAESWARRTIIMNAIRALRPSPTAETQTSSNPVAAGFAVDSPRIQALVQLPTFERFAYVVSVLEGYSDRECALLFGTTREAVVSARVRAIQKLGDSDAVQQQLHSMEEDKQLRPERSLGLTLSPLPITA